MKANMCACLHFEIIINDWRNSLTTGLINPVFKMLPNLYENGNRCTHIQEFTFLRSIPNSQNNESELIRGVLLTGMS